MLLSLLLFLNLLSTTHPVKEDPIQGVWHGKLYQEKGSISQEYDFWLNIENRNGTVRGWSYVVFEDLNATMSFNGSFKKNEIRLAENALLEHVVKTNIEWCLKELNLKVSTDSKTGKKILKGNWTGKTLIGTNCIPGWIILEKEPERV